MAEEAVFGFVLQTIGKIVVEEARFLVGVKDQVAEVAEKLNAMRWYVQEGVGNQDSSRKGRVLEWVLRARTMAYEAENVIETYAIKIRSRRGGAAARRLNRFACLLKECYNKHQSDIDSLLKEITYLTANLQDYWIQQIMDKKDGEENSSQQPLVRRTYCTTNPHQDLFVGFLEEIELLVECVVGKEHPAVSLCGMGGSGKTTRKLYHHPRVRKHFELFSWVSVSQKWEVRDLLLRILVNLLQFAKESSQDERVGCMI